MVSYHYIWGLQPFAIAGRIIFIYMKYGHQWVLSYIYDIHLIRE